MSRPGSVSIDHSEEMDVIVRLGDAVIPNLNADLKNEDASFRLLAMLKANEAVPALIDGLKFKVDSQTI